MRISLTEVQKRFHAGRMLMDYDQKYYRVIGDRQKILSQDNYQNARKLAAWKLKVETAWSGLLVLDTKWHDTANKAMPLGDSLCPEITIGLNGLTLDELGVEMLVIAKRKNPTEPFSVLKCAELQGMVSGDGEATWKGAVRMHKPGVYEYGFRIFPKHPLLAHRQDFTLIKWV